MPPYGQKYILLNIISKQQVMVSLSSFLPTVSLLQVHFIHPKNRDSLWVTSSSHMLFSLLSFFTETALSLFLPLLLPTGPTQTVVISSRWRSWPPPRLGTQSGRRVESPTWWWPTSPPPRRSGSLRNLLSPGEEGRKTTIDNAFKKIELLRIYLKIDISVKRAKS